MPENEIPTTSATGGETPPATQPPVSESPPNATPAGETPAGEPFDQARAQALISKLRDAEKALERRAKEAEAKAKQFEDAQLSETDRREKRLAETEGELTRLRTLHQQTLVERAVERAAAKLNVVDPDAAARLLNWAAIEYDDDGAPTNADALLQQLLAEKPYLRAQAPATPAVAPTAPTNPASRMTPGSTFTKSQITDRKFWEANRAEIMRAMADGRIVD